MIKVLFLCPIGVRKAHEAATATPIRKGSGLTCSVLAMSRAIGAEITAVAVLFITSDRVMVTTISKASTAGAGRSPARPTMPRAISAVPPLASSAAPIGIIEPSSTMTGHSTDS